MLFMLLGVCSLLILVAVVIISLFMEPDPQWTDYDDDDFFTANDSEDDGA